MFKFAIQGSTSIVFAFICLAVTGAFLRPATGQQPAEKNVAKPVETDQDRLQGTWQIQSLALQGQVVKREEKPEGWEDTFGQDISIRGNRLRHAAATEGTFKLDAARDPKQITFQDQDGKLTFRGIYTVERDTLTVCINGDGTDVRRPEEFVTKAGTPLVIVTLKKSPVTK